SFEGMGASREAFFASLGEPVLFVSLLVAARGSHSLALAGMLAPATAAVAAAGPALILVVVALFVLLLSENARIPFDDPNTHLELTMVHEVMVLDHGGVDLAYIGYASALKLWVLAAVTASLVLPVAGLPMWAAASAFLAAMFSLAVVVGA